MFQIPAGLRGFTIGVSTQDSPAAVLVPGDFVDVLVAGNSLELVETPRSPLAIEEGGTRAPTPSSSPPLLAIRGREREEHPTPYVATPRRSPHHAGDATSRRVTCAGERGEEEEDLKL